MSNRILEICAIDMTAIKLLKPLMTACVKSGFIVDCACSDTGHFSELESESFKMVNIPIERRIQPFSNLKSVWKLYRLMKENNYQVVHVHTPIAAVLGRIAARLAGVKNVVYTAHGFYFHEGMNKFEYKFWYTIERFFARWFTDWIFLQSSEDFKLCVEKSFNSPDRLFHLGNGVDLQETFRSELVASESRKSLRMELGLDRNTIVISFIGRLVREKGITELIEAFRLLLEHCAEPPVLLIIGDLLPSDRESDADGWKKYLHQNERIKCLGRRDDIAALLAISNIFVLPSYREGLPRSIIEAMAMGLPIIATNIRGCREEVVHGENGFLVPVGNCQELFEGLLKLVKNSNLRKRFGVRSRELALAMFDEQNVILKQLQLFTRLVEGGYDG
jgi:glycosyltransferase involved in cell wall biosynthesis